MITVKLEVTVHENECADKTTKQDVCDLMVEKLTEAGFIVESAKVLKL